MPRWINRIALLLEADTPDLRALAVLAGGDPHTFYIGTDISGADLRGQDVRGMIFGPFDPQTMQFDESTVADAELLERLAPQEAEVENPPPPDSIGSGPRTRSPLFDILGSSDVAIDLDGGVARIYRKGEGVVLEEPPVYLAQAAKPNQGKLVGSAAITQFQAMDPAAGWQLVAPFAHGDLSDEAQGAALMRLLFKQVVGRSSLRGAAIVSVSASSTPVQRRAVHRAIKRAGASKVALIDRGLAAAIGAGRAVHENRGSMVVDIGASSTEVALVALSGTVHAQTVFSGTATMSQAIAEGVRRIAGIALTSDQAEQLRILHGRAGDDGSVDPISIVGRSSTGRSTKSAELTTRFIRNAMSEQVWQIIHQIKLAIEMTPPEFAVEVAEDGIILTGPGAYVRGIAKEIQDHTGLAVHIAADPQLCTILGCGKILEHPIWMRGVISLSGY